MTLDSIKEEIMNAKDIVILTHEIPDGDAIGSSLALYNGLKQLGKSVDVIIPEYPKTFNFLAGAKEIKKEGKHERYDLAIALDCSDIKRLNGFSGYFEQANKTINIDHHGVNTMFADLNFVNPVAPACAQILVTVLEYLGIEIEKNIGSCLIAGIITDTGGFKYQGVTAETFEFAANLLNKGVNISEVYRKVFEKITRESFELRKLATDRLEFYEDGKISFTYTTKKDEEDLHTSTGDHEGIVELGRAVDGVEVSIYLRETDNGYKASLRSSDYVNVSDICMMFGGGGHTRAAGCNLVMTLDQAKEKILNKVKEYIK